MAGTQVVIDLANSPSFEDKAVLEFFETSGRNLLAAEAAAGVRHHVALSIVGIDRSDNGYFRAKVAQEKLIKTSGIPYTIIRSTQFLEFLRAIADSSADGNTVRISPGLFQPIAAEDVAAAVAELALAGAAKRYRRDSRPGTSTVQQNCRPLSEGRWRPACGRERSRGPILWRPGRGALARAFWARHALGELVSTIGSAAHEQQPDISSRQLVNCRGKHESPLSQDQT